MFVLRRQAKFHRLSSSSHVRYAPCLSPLNRQSRSDLTREKTHRFTPDANAPWIHQIRHFSDSPSPTIDRPFDKVLVANRGEIACRVLRTCRRLGIKTVAVYSEADGPDALHASMADEAYRIGTGPSPAESYLMGDEVLDVARHSGSEAIHPGYGFLSENSIFATKTTDSGLTFIGPPPAAILAMGSKSHSKALMIDASVPTTPGYHGANQEPDFLLHEAVHNVGFPLLIKATMGGGGKGMRLVWSESGFLAALDSCRRESQASFGDDSVILEKYLVDPRHIEIQVMADTLSNCVYLHERDCSLQRRHQKIIEEAPASDLPTSLRELMGDMAVRAAKAVGYVNAGTVEFLLDTKSPGDFFFCEMNTRLQVEHPITEMITGLDLVEWQLKIASGQELPITNQDQIPCVGHAFEARIYAEDPSKNFLPVTGNVWHHTPPVEPNQGGDEIRVDTGIQKGDDVSVYYDPMISKLIVHGPSRPAALKKLTSSLKNYQIAGIPTNIPFLIKCAGHPTFQQAGSVNTGFLEEHADDVAIDSEGRVIDGLSQAICAFCVLSLLENRIGIQDITTARRMTGNPWSNLSGSWRIGGDAARYKRVLTPLTLSGDVDRLIECFSNSDGSFDIQIPQPPTARDDGDHQWAENFNIKGLLDPRGHLQVTANGTQHKALTVAIHADYKKGTININIWAGDKDGGEDEYAWDMSFQHPLPSFSSLNSSTVTGSGVFSVKAPMPGKITRINVSEGQEVKANEVLIVLEAMKMEHVVCSPGDGVVTKLNGLTGEIVEDGYVLAVVEDADAA